MQGSFEKKVQEKMDELKITPSEPVWEKIELQIQPEKKRRAFFWVPFVVLMLAGGFFYFSSVNETPADDNKSPIGNTAATSERLHEKALPPVLKTTERTEENKTAATDIIPNKSVAEKTINRENKRDFFSGTATPFSSVTKEIAVPGTITADRKPKEKNTRPATAEQPVVPVTVDPGPLPEQSGVAVSENKEPVQESRHVEESKLPSADTVAKDEIKDPKEMPPTVDTANVKRKIARLQSKWRKTFVLQGGWNRPVAGLFSSAALDYYASPTTGANNPPQSGYTNAGYGPARVTGGHSFAIGAGLTRTISPHFDVSFGLQYSFHRLHTNVGSFQRIDTAFALSNRSTAVQGYYRNGSNITYNISQHLVEFPVSISYKPITKLPLSLGIGASYGRLLRSNILTYNYTRNAFYYTRDNITKNHFSVFSSLQYGLLNRPAFQLSLGPVVQYQVTSMQKQPSGTLKRISFAGIRTSINF